MLYRALCMSVGFSFVGRGFRFSRNVAFESSGLLGSSFGVQGSRGLPRRSYKLHLQVARILGSFYPGAMKVLTRGL